MRNSKIKLLYKPFGLSFTPMSSPNSFLGVASFEVTNSSMSNTIEFFNVTNSALKRIRPCSNNDTSDSDLIFKFPITSCKFAPNPACESTDYILTASEKVKLYSISSLTSNYNHNQSNNNSDKIKDETENNRNSDDDRSNDQDGDNRFGIKSNCNFIPKCDSNDIRFNMNSENELNANFYEERFNNDGSEVNIQSNNNKSNCCEDLGLNNEEAEIKLRSTIQVNKTNHPITSLDWNRLSRASALVSSTDNSVSLLDVSQGCISARVMAHENPVHDVTFCDGSNTFVTAGFDGSLRLFDLRDLSTLLVLYQAAMPLLRTCVCPFDSNRIALFGRAATGVTLVDVRMPGLPSAASTHVDNEVCGIAWSLEDDGVLFSINTAGQLRVCNFASGKTMAPNHVIYSTHCRNEALAVTGNCVAIAYKNKVEIVPIIGEKMFDDDIGVEY